MLHDRTGRLESINDWVFESAKLHDRTGRLENQHRPPAWR